MILVTINGQSYSVCSEWKDLNISKAAELHKIPMPETLRNCYTVAVQAAGMPEKDAEIRLDEAERQITIEDQHKHFPGYFLSVIACLSDIPEAVLRQTDVNSIKAIYQTYMKQFVEGVHFIPAGFTAMDIESFEFDGETFLLPKSKKVFGVDVPMVDVSALEFTESADLMVYMARIEKDKDINTIANLISILCRPEGEKYNEEVSLARAERFKGLTMDVVWGVFFSLITPLIILSQSALISSLQAEKEILQN